MSESAVRTTDWKTDLPTLERTSRDLTFDRARWVLIAAWIIVLACLPFAAERTSSWGHLKHLVSTGSITEVEVNGEHFSGNGFSTVDLHWRQHGLNYRAEVIQLFGDQDDSDCGEADACSDTSATTLHSPPSVLLQDLQPGLTVARQQRAHYDDDNRLLGFAVPGIIAFTELLLALAALGLLISGPQTWRATKWAWFWWLSNPFGMAAFLLLSGPTRGIRPPRVVSRRITGGWALLMRIVLTSVYITIWGLQVGI